MRITCIISLMECGGTPRALSTMCNYWSSNAHTVTILGVYDHPDGSFFELNQDISYLPLGIMPATDRGLGRWIVYIRGIRRLRTEIIASKPDIVISFLDYVNVLTLLATRNLSFPVIVSERTAPSASESNFLWKFCRYFLYPYADAVTAVASSSFKDINLGRSQLHETIPGPIRLPPKSFKKNLSSFSVVGLGRLSPEKNFEALIETFDQIAAKYPDWSLTIWGDGPCRQDLEQLIRNSPNRGNIHLPGVAADSYQALQATTIFVLPSKYEGYPHALVEAMLSGLAVVAYDCPGAIREIIEHGKNGLIVPLNDQAALTAAIDLVISDPSLRLQLGQAAEAMNEICDLEACMTKWSILIEKCIKNRDDKLKAL